MAYKTKQRDTIVQYFATHPGQCFTARELVQVLPVGEATVFRNLTLLTQDGIIQKFADDGHGAVYQFSGCSENHIHLKCKTCSRLIHLDCTFMEEITRHFAAEHGFCLDCGQTILYGLCDGCAGRVSSIDPCGRDCVERKGDSE